MNGYQIKELKRCAELESRTELNEDKMVFALCKNGTSFGKITTDEKLVDTFVENYNYSINAIYVNGEEQEIRDYKRLSNR